MKKKKKLRPKYTAFRPRVYSRHPTHGVLRPRENSLPLFPFKSCIRLGSTTDRPDTVTNGGNRIELNTIEAVKNSANKLKMKQKFTENQVKTADWWQLGNDGTFFQQDQRLNIEELPYPIISKNIFGSRGTGNTKHDDAESLRAWLEGKDTSKYIFEKFYNFSREYRLHVSSEGCFYTCRKMLKRDTPDEAKWYRNDDHCVWVMQENELFDKPVNWEDVVNQSVAALNAVGLDFGAVDLRIQSATNKKGVKRDAPEFIVVEINSAPSFGDVTSQKYLEELPKILMRKYNERENG